MSLRCLVGRHRPMLSSIVSREDRLTALCDDCGALIERKFGERWISAEPLLARHSEAA